MTVFVLEEIVGTLTYKTLIGRARDLETMAIMAPKLQWFP